LSFDHRLIDGALATEFLNTLAKYLEDPDLFFVKMT
ncbi:MAG TPA: 2-oxo acid dehydrogenase subunit E2, partial [archaeon]|nr:2-oxo acid dehydrogenase subunit E2 [archaeon]